MLDAFVIPPPARHLTCGSSSPLLPTSPLSTSCCPLSIRCSSSFSRSNHLVYRQAWHNHRSTATAGSVFHLIGSAEWLHCRHPHHISVHYLCLQHDRPARKGIKGTKKKKKKKRKANLAANRKASWQHPSVTRVSPRGLFAHPTAINQLSALNARAHTSVLPLSRSSNFEGICESRRSG